METKSSKSWVRFGYSRIKKCPAGIELPAWAINTRKATVKIRRNPQLQIFHLFLFFNNIVHCILNHISFRAKSSKFFNCVNIFLEFSATLMKILCLVKALLIGTANYMTKTIKKIPYDVIQKGKSN